MKDVLTQKIADALAAQPPPLTRRDVRLPAVRGKAPAVIGMRRSGKKTFLWQCIQGRVNAGASAEFPDATPILLTLDSMPPQPPLPSPLC